MLHKLHENASVLSLHVNCYCTLKFLLVHWTRCFGFIVLNRLTRHRYEYVEKLENNVPGQAEFGAFFVTHYSTRI
jgi:hypothetical protein